MKELRKQCIRHQQLSRSVIDEFLIYYADRRNNAEKGAKKKLDVYQRNLKAPLPASWYNMSISQYIAYSIFKENGYIKKYLNHSGLDHLTGEEMTFLKEQSSTPWRFSFAEITGKPDHDFYDLTDAFTGEEYLLYSPGLANIAQSQSIRLTFNLISYDGGCYHTYGSIGAYNSFDKDDIRYFATELNNGRYFESDEELMLSVGKNPVPYMFLIVGSVLPVAQHKEHTIKQVTAEYIDETFRSEAFKKHFTAKYSRGVYEFSLKGRDQFPHFASVYYDETEELLFLYAMTDAGFRSLVDALNKSGYDLTYRHDVRVGMSMVNTAKEILGKEIQVNPYSGLFDETPVEIEDTALEGLNRFLQELIPYINSGKRPDLGALAAKSGIDPEEARNLYDQVRGKTGL